MNRLTFSLAMLTLCLAGCHSIQAVKPLDVQIADAHGWDKYKELEALAGDIHVVFKDGSQFDAHFVHEMKTGRTRMQLADESVLVFDGQCTWVWPANSSVKDPRHNLTTWPFLVTLPMRLHSAGATLSGPTTRKWANMDYDALTLSFAPNAEYRSNDWFVVYADKETHLLKAVGYVITGGRPLVVAEKEPVGLTMYSFKQHGGVLFAEDWKIWRYNKDEGFFGLPIGEARIYNLEFYRPGSKTFAPPEGARRVGE
ncbi:MAG: hypothetical protein ABSH20_17585 [Tepidisphaeraceae bacterium]|jgi:hypothetical protein